MSNEPPYRRAYADASWTPFWLDRADRPAARPALEADRTADLVIVGGGFTGLWAAVQALEDLPGREVVVLEGERVAFGATGRNGGFCDASLTHGLENGSRAVPRRDRADRAGGTGEPRRDRRHDRAPRHRLLVGADGHADRGDGAARRSRGATTPWRASPRSATTWRSSIATRCARRSTRRRTSPGSGSARVRRSVDPARLAWGLAATAEGLGAAIHEHSPGALDRGGR